MPWESQFIMAGIPESKSKERTEIYVMRLSKSGTPKREKQMQASPEFNIYSKIMPAPAAPAARR